MASPSEKPFYSYFNIIICRYNEIGLKSKQVRARMEYGLINYARNICQREELQVLSVLRLGGRLIFFFPHEQIVRAITVFRHIIGFCSISPGFSVSKEYDIVQKNALEFAESYIQDGDSFALRAKRLKPYPKESQQIEREIGGDIHDRLTKLGRNIKVNLTEPNKTIFIEIREKGAYIYAQKIPTIWAGNPIERDKAALAYITENRESILAAQLLLRRGTFITPFILDWGKYSLQENKTQIWDSLKVLAKFYSESMTAVKLCVEPLYSILMQKPEDLVRCNYFFYVLVDKLVHHLNEKRLLKYEHQPLLVKGITTAFEPSQQITLQVSQQFPTVTFTPIIGLTSIMKRDLLERLFISEKPWDWNSIPNLISAETDNDFSLADAVISHLDEDERGKQLSYSPSSNSDFQYSACPFEIIRPQPVISSQQKITSFIDENQIEVLKKEVESPEIQGILQYIIDHSEFMSIKGRILAKEETK